VPNVRKITVNEKLWRVRVPLAPSAGGTRHQELLVQPQDWDERGKGVKNDRLDAAALCQRLDRFERGNKKAFSTVRIPTVDEERERAISRGFVESVHGTSGSGEIRVGVPARSGVRQKSEHP
jgi:hypothetical protein